MDKLTLSSLLAVSNTACLCALLASRLAWGQPDVDSAHVLFEPRPIPEAADQALPLVSFNAASSQDGAVPEPVDRGPTPAERRAMEATIAAYVTAIGDEESEEGPYSSHLKEDLFAAGQVAQQLPDHDQALDFFRRAQNVERINNGLESLDQIPIMLAMAESRKALGDVRDADGLQESILNLMQQVYGERSLEVIPTMLDYGVWNMDAFLGRSNILLNIDRMNVAQFMTDPMNYIHEGKTLRETPLFNLYQAQQSFLHAIQILIDNRQYFHPRILELERMLLKSYLLSIHRENILYEPDFYLTRKKTKTGSRLNTNSIELMESEEYKLGNASHQRSIAYISNNPERTSSQLASAMLEAADWHLLFERKVKASRDYQYVYDFFGENPEMAASVEPILYPEYPVILPTYLPPPNSREKLEIGPDDPVNFFGYFDVSYRIDKFGKAKRIRFLGQGGEVTRNQEIRLSQYLQNVLFRPLFRDGKPFTGEIRLRYYVGI